MFKEEEITFAELAQRLNITNLDEPEVYDLDKEGGFEYQIKSIDPTSGKEVWKDLEKFVVKKNSDCHYRLGTLKGTSAHRVWYNGEFVALNQHPEAVRIEEPIQVVDCQVADTHTYVAEGQINHNTTTPGGKALPYASSVRIKIGSPTPLKKVVDGKERVYGVGVTAKVIKNRMSNPFREVEFEIHFGKGIREQEQVFDYLRDWCARHEKNPVVVNGQQVLVEGTGAWKTFTLTDVKTNLVTKEVKFYKSDFGEKVLYNPEFAKEMAALMDAAYIMQTGDTDHLSFAGVDSNSVEEMEEASGKNDTPTEE